MQRPTALPVDLDAIPTELQALPQWVAWQYRWIPKDRKWKKIPINPRTGRKASTCEASTWGTIEEAHSRMVRKRLDGIGFVFTDADAFVGIDLDNVVEAQALDRNALSMLERFRSYAEVSPSGTGVHIIMRCTSSSLDNRKHQGIEFFRTRSFITFTGQPLPDGTHCDGAVADLTAAVPPWHESYFPYKLGTKTHRARDEDRSTTPADMTLEDSEVVAACRANSLKFGRLFDEGDISGYDHDDSRADLALAAILVRHGLRDPESIARIIRGSALVREKWDRPDYLPRTIQAALDTNNLADNEAESLERDVARLTQERDAAVARADRANEMLPWIARIRRNKSLRNVRTTAIVLTNKFASFESRGVAPPYQISFCEIAESAGTHPRTASRHVETLESEGLLLRETKTMPKAVNYETGEIEPMKTQTFLTPSGSALEFARCAAELVLPTNWGGKRKNAFGRSEPHAVIPTEFPPGPRRLAADRRGKSVENRQGTSVAGSESIVAIEPSNRELQRSA